jgi:hypothetical protein
MMKVRGYLCVCVFSLASATLAPVRVRAANISDQMVVMSGTTVLFNQTIPEPVFPLQIEQPLVYGKPFSVAALTGLSAVKVVALTEPSNAVLDGHEVPITLPGGKKAMLSDVVISVPGTLTGFFMTGSVILVSDEDTVDLPVIAGMMPSAWSNITVLPETGSLQNLTAPLGITGGVSVQVLSDLEVVPEPGTGLLALLGLCVLGGHTLRRRRS